MTLEDSFISLLSGLSKYSIDRFTEPIPPNLPQFPEVLLLGCLSCSVKLNITSSKLIEPSFKFGLTNSVPLEFELLLET